MAIILPLLSSCGIHTDYQRPTNLPLDSLYRDIQSAIDEVSRSFTGISL